MRRVLGFALATAAFAACDGSPAESDAGADAALDVGTPDVAVDVAADVAVEAEAGVTCGIDQVWSDMPQHLACTGLYTNFASKTTDAAALSYAPGVVLWSDGATKQRWLYLPPSTKIDTSNMDEWVFPVGTKVWKEFQIGGKRIETRIFHKSTTTTWLWTTYQWTSDETDAVRLDDGATNVVATYEIPKHDYCNTCHSGRADQLLGIEAIALSLSAAQGATLDWLSKNNKLTAPPSTTTASLPEDATGKAAAALGAMHIGCGVSCHNENVYSAANSSGFFARLPAAAVLGGTAVVTALDTYTTSANITPTGAPYSSYVPLGYKRLLPHDASKSLIVTVSGERGAGQMPPIVTHVVDTTATQEITDWINAL